MIVVESKRKSMATILNKYPDAKIIDVTAKSPNGFVMLSPHYPHGGIPIPSSGVSKGCCVEGIWEGLKVFENSGVDIESLRNKTMKNLKRTVRSNGEYHGHQRGLDSNEILNCVEARKQIYLPCYLWMLENKASRQVDYLKALSENQVVVLLDYNTNDDVNDATSPLSHASLIKAYIEGTYPECERFDSPKSASPFDGVRIPVEGNRVKHHRYGEGVVDKVTDDWIYVRFREGRKKLALFRSILEILD